MKFPSRKRPADFGKAITLNFLCYNLIETEEEKNEEKPDTTRSYIRHITFHDRERKEEFTDLLEMVFVELGRMDHEHEDPESLRDQWTTFFRLEDETQLEELCHRNAIFDKAVDQMIHISDEDVSRYHKEQRRLAVQDALAREKAIREESVKKEKEATVKRLAAESSDISMIARVADLTEAEVLKILG